MCEEEAKASGLQRTCTLWIKLEKTNKYDKLTWHETECKGCLYTNSMSVFFHANVHTVCSEHHSPAAEAAEQQVAGRRGSEKESPVRLMETSDCVCRSWVAAFPRLNEVIIRRVDQSVHCQHWQHSVLPSLDQREIQGQKLFLKQNKIKLSCALESIKTRLSVWDTKIFYLVN